MNRVRFLLPSFLVCVLMTGAGAAPQSSAPLTGAFDPETVLANLEVTVQERDWRRYGDFLAEDFHFIPFDSVPLEHPPVEWDEWGRAREIGFVQELVSPSHKATLALLDNVLDRGSESYDRSEWDLVYTLTTRGQVFRSRAVFLFTRIKGLWYLKEWTDTTIETDKETGSAFPTSGSLRGTLTR